MQHSEKNAHMHNLKKRIINFAHRILEFCIKMQVKWLQLQHTSLNVCYFALLIVHTSQSAPSMHGS